MRTRSSHSFCPRAPRSVRAAFAPQTVRNFPHWQTARRLTLALAASVPVCAGALMAGPVQAAPVAESDENGPLVQIIKPGYNDVLKGKYRILIQVTARKYNPQSVEMFIDDKSATSGPMEISSFASSSYDFDTRLMSDGPHKLKVRVTDSQGFRGWSEVTVYVNNHGVMDTRVPDLRWVGIEPFQEVSGSVKFEINPSTTFGVKWLQISINPANAPSKPAHSWFMNQPPYRVSLDTLKKELPDGLYVLKATAWNSLDEQGESPPLTIGVVNSQINSTRVQDMLEGQRQMQRVLAGEKPTTEQSATPTETPVAVLAAPQKTAPQIKADGSTPAGHANAQSPTLLPATPKTGASGIQLPAVKSSGASKTDAAADAATSNDATRLAASLPVSKRVLGEANLSRAFAVEMALTPAASATDATRLSQPIAIARFGQPNLLGRDVADVPVMSPQLNRDQSRLSNAELSRARSNQTRVLNAVRSLAVPLMPLAPMRALQTSAPAPQPRLGAASAPASTRQALKQPAKTAQPAFSGSLSKTALASQRLAPLAPITQSSGATQAATRGVISKAALSTERAKPVELLAKNSAAPAPAPQMSAPRAPRMSESASGVGVPSRASQDSLAKPRAQSGGVAARTLNGERVAALPRPDAARSQRNGASIVAAPLDAPLQIAESNAMPVPVSYRSERATTLRAVAARYGLPVELVALSNGLPSDAKIQSGTEIKLPRPLQVSYNGVPVTGDAPSMLAGDTAVTAFRFMFEKTGGKMEWDAKNQRVVARKDGREITLSIGSNIAKVGEREVMMELAAFLFQGRTMVPLRFFEEGLNAQVEWNPQTGRLVVAMAGEVEKG